MKPTKHQANCDNVFELALTSEERAGDFHWHPFAHHKRSSQAMCVSALGTLRHADFADTRESVLSALVAGAFPGWPADALTNWNVEIESRAPELLNECGLGTPSSLDGLLTARNAVVAVEAKFARDAADGFGGCGQFHREGEPAKCAGFRGRGSDLEPKTQIEEASCRLEIAEGRRTARWYWKLGREYFREEVFREQQRGDTCWFRDSNFQLMRNFLCAAETAKLKPRRQHFGLLVLCSRRRDLVLREQLAHFREQILKDEHKASVALVHYEQLIDLLGNQAQRLSEFLSDRITKVLG